MADEEKEDHITRLGRKSMSPLDNLLKLDLRRNWKDMISSTTPNRHEMAKIFYKPTSVLISETFKGISYQTKTFNVLDWQKQQVQNYFKMKKFSIKVDLIGERIRSIASMYVDQPVNIQQFVLYLDYFRDEGIILDEHIVEFFLGTYETHSNLRSVLDSADYKKSELMEGLLRKYFIKLNDDLLINSIKKIDSNYQTMMNEVILSIKHHNYLSAISLLHIILEGLIKRIKEANIITISEAFKKTDYYNPRKDRQPSEIVQLRLIIVSYFSYNEEEHNKLDMEELSDLIPLIMLGEALEVYNNPNRVLVRNDIMHMNNSLRLNSKNLNIVSVMRLIQIVKAAANTEELIKLIEKAINSTDQMQV